MDGQTELELRQDNIRTLDYVQEVNGALRELAALVRELGRKVDELEGRVYDLERK